MRLTTKRGTLLLLSLTTQHVGGETKMKTADKLIKVGVAIVILSQVFWFVGFIGNLCCK
jgi:hypothetical protein